RLAGGCTDCTVRLWDVATGQQCGQLGQPLPPDPPRLMLRERWAGVSCLAFSGDGKILAAFVVQLNKRALYLWDVPSGKVLRQFTIPEKHPTAVVSVVALSRDGKTLASIQIQDNTIHLWNVATAKEYQPLAGHQAQVVSIAFDPVGKVLASGSMDG